MTKIIKLNILSFCRKKTFKNYMIINTTIILIITILNISKSFITEEISRLINDENNRIINIDNYEDKNKLTHFFNENKDKINNIEYYIEDYSIKIDGLSYLISTTDNKEEKYYAASNINYKSDDITIGSVKINLKKSNDIPEDEIHVNQYTSSYICNNIDTSECLISFELKNYFDEKIIFKEMEKYNIEGNFNESINNTIKLYQNINSILFVTNFLITTVFILISIIMNINFIIENKNNIIIYRNVGYKKNIVILLYIITIMFYITIIELLIILLSIIATLIIKILYDIYINPITYIYPYFLIALIVIFVTIYYVKKIYKVKN